MNTKRLCFACDLKNDPKLIDKYKHYHVLGNGISGTIKAIRDAGIIEMAMSLIGNH